jgi:hypothetical protein
VNLSRRTLLAAFGSALLELSPGLTRAQEIATGGPYSDKSVTDAWIQSWMASPGAAVGSLHLGRFADAMYWLREPIGWEPNKGQEQYQPVKVPAGFVTDFASIPRIFWIALPKDGLYTYPAIVHDYLYWEQTVSKDEADLILKMSMEDFKISSATMTAIYKGVQLGGGSAWKDNAARKKAGEKRYMKEFPSSPTVRWDDWRSKPGNMKSQA